MIIFTSKPHFDSNTGQPRDPKKVISERRCDYCGEVLSEQYSVPCYSFDYEDHDACFGSDGEEFQFVKSLGEGDFTEALYYTPYIFCARFICDGMDIERDWRPCEMMLINEVLFNVTQGEGYFKDIDSMIDAWRASRIRAMKRLIEQEKISAENLSSI